MIDRQPSILKPSEQENVSGAKAKLAREGKPLEVGRIMAELSFGFWTSLLDARYEQGLWPKLLKPTFPHMPRQIRTRKNLSRRLNRIRHLRNRVFHHEPVWHWQDLARQHSETIETIGWISSELRDTMRIVDRFPVVYDAGSTVYQRSLERMLLERSQ